ncbi:glucose 1-dehydrogenase [Arthrobacter sp. SX1312]|uniref:glucose 1-dehydrogenase n=1 Tax=Arthrobacter sp. SX1312 TaxID=2058896 RepID=UPI0015E255C5|nr:glucose 1-dehydrogenase [Arthrobacter sp. SX1312]
MRALTVTPGVADSLELRDIAAPPPEEGDVLVDTLSVGLCGTDSEIVAGDFGVAPPGQDHLVLGHENLGRVAEAPAGSDLAPGDIVVGIVRRPDPVPCGACAAGEWDMCLNGRYAEHGIKELDGFARQQWRGQADALVKLDPALQRVGVLLEPTTVVCKAWEQIERIGQRAYFAPETVAVTGAGPVGLLAALLGIQRGLEVHVYDLITEGPKPGLVRDLGAVYHTDSLQDSQVRPDVIIECTGVAPVILEAITGGGQNSITCLTGISGVGGKTPTDIGDLNRTTVLQNEVIFGTVNANKRHYTSAAAALAAADESWLERMITRRVRIDDFRDAFEQHDDDVKVVLDFQDPT